MEKIYDKTGREILPFDVVKVFHFTDNRRKKHYMYKQAIGVKFFSSDVPFMEFSHLHKEPGTYVERMESKILDEYEIVQGFCDEFGPFYNRPKLGEET